MANNLFVARSPAEIACYNAGLEKTILQVQAPANIRVKVLGWGIYFDGTAITADPVEITLLRQSSAGTMTPMTAIQINSVPETVQSLANYNATVEPSVGDIVDLVQVHPQSGFEVKYPKGEEVIIPAGERLAIRTLAGAEVNCSAKIICEE